MNEQHIIYISWDDCTHLYPSNTPNDFIIELPQTLILTGNWICGLLEVKYITKDKTNEQINSFFICCDICEESFVLNTKLPILRRCQVVQDDLLIAEKFNKINYMKITRDYVRKIRIFMKDNRLADVGFAEPIFDCTLHLLKI